jgi:heme/copper-type cytochrome/quinol oxidase subunit 2
MPKPAPSGLRQLAVTFAVLTIVLFALAGATHKAHHGPGAVAADIGWFGFQLSLVALVVVGLVAGARAVRDRRRVAGR